MAFNCEFALWEIGIRKCLGEENKGTSRGLLIQTGTWGSNFLKSIVDITFWKC